MTDKIKEALATFDPAKDEFWTADGLPKIEVVGIVGLKRSDITKVAPHFTRANPVLETPGEIAAEKAKPEAPTLEQRHLEAKKLVDKTAILARNAQQEYSKALAALDTVEREIAAIHGKRTSQDDIMDYLAAQKRRREEMEKAAS